MSSKTKGTLSLLLGIVGIIATIHFARESAKKGAEEALEVNHKEVIEILTTIHEDIKAIPDSMKFPSLPISQDSLILERIAKVDTCIDKHFYRVNLRLQRIEDALQMT